MPLLTLSFYLMAETWINGGRLGIRPLPWAGPSPMASLQSARLPGILKPNNLLPITSCIWNTVFRPISPVQIRRVEIAASFWLLQDLETTAMSFRYWIPITIQHTSMARLGAFISNPSPWLTPAANQENGRPMTLFGLHLDSMETVRSNH